MVFPQFKRNGPLLWACFLWAAGWGGWNPICPLLAQSDGPFRVGLETPALTTPQWVGEKGVEAVVILSIDDLRTPEKYESYLRPILNRLKQIDGRAPAGARPSICLRRLSMGRK